MRSSAAAVSVGTICAWCVQVRRASTAASCSTAAGYCRTSPTATPSQSSASAAVMPTGRTKARQEVRTAVASIGEAGGNPLPDLPSCRLGNGWMLSAPIGFSVLELKGLRDPLQRLRWLLNLAAREHDQHLAGGVGLSETADDRTSLSVIVTGRLEDRFARIPNAFRDFSRGQCRRVGAGSVSFRTTPPSSIHQLRRLSPTGGELVRNCLAYKASLFLIH